MSSREKLKEIDESFVKDRSKKVSAKDVDKVIRESGKILKRSRRGPLAKLLEKVQALIDLVKDYWSGRYRKVPWWVISAAVSTLLYVLMPVDLIPDFIPGIGLLDDAAVVLICIRMINEELNRYLDWRDSVD